MTHVLKIGRRRSVGEYWIKLSIGVWVGFVVLIPSLMGRFE
jgi:hypothetical protein